LPSRSMPKGSSLGRHIALNGNNNADTATQRRRDRTRNRPRIGTARFYQSNSIDPLLELQIPSFPHIASTFAFVAASISIIAGHGRSNPSAFHLRVASMPIFDP
jgi:hypothetical protein